MDNISKKNHQLALQRVRTLMKQKPKVDSIEGQELDMLLTLGLVLGLAKRSYDGVYQKVWGN